MVTLAPLTARLPVMVSPALSTRAASVPDKFESILPSPAKNGAVTLPALTLMPEDVSRLYWAAPPAVKVPLEAVRF